MEATISSGDRRPSPRKKWWNAQNVVAGLKNRDESDLSDEEIDDDDSATHIRKKQQRLIAKVKKGKENPKVMESPVYLIMLYTLIDNSIFLR